MIKYESILERYTSELKLIDDYIVKYVEQDVPLLSSIVDYIFQSGGKRLRPVLVLLTGEYLGVKKEELISTAALIEFVHTATLLHDDVIDNAEMRRSRKTARLIWGNEAAVLVGDYLFSLTFKIISRTSSKEALEILSNATTRMAKGELIQLSRSFNTASVEDYISIVENKTSALFEAAAGMAAIQGNASAAVVEAFRNYALKVGTAFQIVDDTLDYLNNSVTIGKDVGTDLKERKITLPLSHLLTHAVSEDKDVLNGVLNKELITDDDFYTVKELALKYNSPDYSLSEAAKYAEQAKKSLQNLGGDREIIDLLNQLADFSCQRSK